MSDSVSLHRSRTTRKLWGSSRLGLPIWAIFAFATCVFVAFAPNVVYLYGVHNDYEMAVYAAERRSFFQESQHLMAIGRPVAALLSNIPMLPVHAFDDFRWTRIFSMLTMCILGAQLIRICMRALRVRAMDALGIALATFLTPTFIYSILNATAWAPHLITVFISFASYAVLSRTNMQALTFLSFGSRADSRVVWRQIWIYISLRYVVIASLLMQLALYDAPPNALLITIFPVVCVLFSPTPWAYRVLIAFRDVAFAAGNLAIYAATTKLFYMPLASLFGFGLASHPSSAFAIRIAHSYEYAFNTDLRQMLSRLGEIAKASGDLWFLPQAEIHIGLGAAILLALVLAAAHGLIRRRKVGDIGLTEPNTNGWLGSRAWPVHGMVVVGVLAAAFLLSASAVLASSGGFITYRTIPACMALAAIVAIYLARRALELISRFIGSTPQGTSAAGDAAVIAMICAAVVGNFYMNDLVMRLARNEMAYFTDIVRRADAGNKQAILILDDRPFTLPEDHSELYDAKGRWIPPYELGCFSGPCLQTGAIVKVMAQRFGLPVDKFKVYALQGDDIRPGLTCKALQSPTFVSPAGLSEPVMTLLAYLRTLPLECVTYSLDWLDLSRDEGG